jgi:ABC-2 type transport system permease protein
MMDTSAILAIAYRDLLKFLRDPLRLVSTLIFPVIFIGILGGSFEANLGNDFGYNYLVFTFTGVLAQTLFQSSAMGIVSLIEDRENDFSQEIFVSPISRYSIVFGKILGESLVAFPQGLAIVIFGLVIGVSISGFQLIRLLPVAIAASIFGGSFGMIVMANISSQRAANQIFPFIMLPQYFLAGVFSPIQILPWYLDFLSRISPMRYAVDLTRGVFYAAHPDYPDVVLEEPMINLTIMLGLFLVFMLVGTWLFVRSERNR